MQFFNTGVQQAHIHDIRHQWIRLPAPYLEAVQCDSRQSHTHTTTLHNNIIILKPNILRRTPVNILRKSAIPAGSTTSDIMRR